MSAKTNRKLALGLFCLLLLGVGPVLAADVMDTYEWKPIHLGAGGWAEGIVCSETDPNVRFVRTDTGQFYRWSVADKMWLPMIVQNTDGSGFGKEIFPENCYPIVTQDGHMALDPNDNQILYLYFHARTFGMSPAYGSLPYNVYKSTDGGRNFKATRFNETARFSLTNDDTFCPPLDFASMHQDGDIMVVDPNNSKVVYVGTATKGIFKTVDGGDTWANLSGNGLPAPRGANDINILPWRKGGTALVNGVTVSKIIYLVYSKGTDTNKNAAAAGNVYRTADGGMTWANLTATNGPAERCCNGVLDPNTGALYVRVNRTNLTYRNLWKYDGKAWAKVNTSDVTTLMVDPKNPDNLLVAGSLATWGLSTNGGKTWRSIPRPYLCSGKHPQGFAGSHPGGNMFGQMRMDMWGTVWVIEGNDGAVKWKFDPDAREIDCIPDTAGIESFNPDDIVFPKNWGGKILLSVQDENGMIVNNPDTLDLTNFKPRPGLCNGMEISVCPNNSDTFSYNGYTPCITVDGGRTSTILTNPARAAGKNLGFGCLQVGRRGDWKAGADHLVWVFTSAAWYSHDGGKTWSQSKTDLSALKVATAPWWSTYYVVADPFVADKFYGYFTDGSFWTTTDGGVTWAKGQSPCEKALDRIFLRANDAVQNDLWAMTAEGMFHTADGGATWKNVPGNLGLKPGRASSIALGKGSGRPGDAPYTVYYVYVPAIRTEPAKDCGIFRSTDAGATWDRIAIHPAGLLAPMVIGASWDTYGLVGVSIAQQNYVYGKLKPEMPAAKSTTSRGTP